MSRTEERVHHCPFRDRVEQSAEIFLISLFCGDKMDRYVVGYRARQGAHFLLCVIQYIEFV